MTAYTIPEVPAIPTAPPRTVYTVASGDLRPSANIKCWPVQQRLEADVTRAVESFGWSVVRGHPVDERAGHGFIDSQRKGLEVFAGIPPDAALIVVEAVWQYSHHVLAGLRTHRGPILVVANWNGTFPGLRSEEHTSELQSLRHLVCRLLLEKKKKNNIDDTVS